MATRAMPACASSGLSLLQATRPASRQGRGGCKHPTKPVPLRRLPANPADLVVELVVKPAPAAACTLPPQQLELSQELAPLLALDTLHPGTLVARLEQAEQVLAQLPPKLRQAAAAAPAFIGFLERSLEVVTQRGLGPAAPLRLLSLLSLLPLGDGRSTTSSSTPAANGNGNIAAGAAAAAADAAAARPQDGNTANGNGYSAAGAAAAAAASLDASSAELREGYLNFYRHLITVLEDSAKREPSGLVPAAIVRCYECWAALGLGVSPPRSSLVGRKLRELLQGSKMGTQDCVRLLVAFAGIRRRTGGQFHPCNYDVSDVVSGLVLGVQQLSAEQLLEVAAAATQFEWPVYRSPVWALDCVAQEAIRRLSTEELPPEAGKELVQAAVAAAAAIRPRLGQELQQRVQEWGLAAAAGAATAAAAQAVASWAEAEATASVLSNAVAFALLPEQPEAPAETAGRAHPA